MPWISLATMFGSADVKGTEGDGKLTAGLALFAGLVALIGLSTAGRSAIHGAAVLCLVGVGASIYEWRHIASRIDRLDIGDAGRASVGTGIWVMLVGFVVGAVCLFKAAPPTPLDAYKNPVPTAR